MCIRVSSDLKKKWYHNVEKAKKIEYHRRKYERKRAECEFEKNLTKRVKTSSSKEPNSDPEAGSSGDGGLPNYYAVDDPEINQTVDDSELYDVLVDLCKDPVSNFLKFATHPNRTALNDMIMRKKAEGLWPIYPGLGISHYADDPEINDAFRDIYDNPLNIEKYYGNPKIMKLISYLLKQSNVNVDLPGCDEDDTS